MNKWELHFTNRQVNTSKGIVPVDSYIISKDDGEKKMFLGEQLGGEHACLMAIAQHVLPGDIVVVNGKTVCVLGETAAKNN